MNIIEYRNKPGSELSMTGIKFISHKNKQILYLDFTNMKAMEALNHLENSKTVIIKQPRRTIFLLVNASGMHVEGNLPGFIKSYVIKIINDYLTFCSHYVIASAVIPPVKLNKDFISSIKRPKEGSVGIFEDIENAKEWLVEQC